MSHRCVLLALLVLPASLPAAVADDQGELEQSLHAFVAEIDQRATPEITWAEELIYISPARELFGKAEKLAGMDADDPAAGVRPYPWQSPLCSWRRP